MAAVAEAVRTEYEALGAKAGEVWQRASELTDETLDSVRRRARDLKHVPDDMAYHVRQAPLSAVGGALAAGLVAGALCGWLASKSFACRPAEEK